MTTLSTSAPSTTLRGASLWLMRITWVILVALSIGFTVFIVPAQTRGAETHWQVQQSYPAVAAFLTRAQFATYFLVLNYGLALLFLLIGLFIFARKSNDWVALLVALGLALTPLAQNLVGFADWEDGLLLPWSQTWHRIYHIVRSLGIVSYFLMFFLFPRGRLAHAPPRWLQIILLGLVGVISFIAALQGDLDIDYVLRSLISVDPFAILIIIFLITFICGSLAQVSVYRQSNEMQRRQMKWVILGLLLATLLNVIGWLHYLIPDPHPAWLELEAYHLGLVASAVVPLAFGIAILRHHLWDIDLFIRRALVYSALIGIIVVVYVAVVGGLGALINQVGSPLTTALATGLTAVMINPLRTGLQRRVNRMVYGYRDDPTTLLNQLSQHLESAAAPEATLARIVETLANALKLPYVAIADGVAWGTRPLHAAILSTFPLLYQGAVIGHLLAAPRASSEALSREDKRVLEAMARLISPAVRAAGLTQELQQSRQRIVAAREEERRRIRRDLHDGLGPTLAAQTLKLDAAIDLIETQPQNATALLRQLKLQTQTVVTDIRRLVYELRPPALDELGLVGAVKNLGFSISDFRIVYVAPESLPSLPAAVEVAAYRITAEAVTNVIKHAGAKSCQVSISILATEAVLQLSICDDGIGLSANMTMGIGLRAMRERAEELGGQLVIESPASNSTGQGTCVMAQLPISDQRLSLGEHRS